MVIVKKIEDLKKLLRNDIKRTGFVPTMGYLHEGHLSLVKASVVENERTVVSIYVNPSQFGANEDLGRYPRNIERDSELLEKEGVDIIFIPDNSEMYPEGYLTWTEVTELDSYLCGASRPGHFKGVVTIVLKLFNIIRPDKAYMGLKDVQQYLIIRKMCKDLNLDVEVVGMPLVRDKDGLALSSRNRYLSDSQREDALVLNRTLKKIKNSFDSGEKRVMELRKLGEEEIKKADSGKIDYLNFVSSETLKDIDQICNGGVIVAMAVVFGSTRLIDNLIIGDI